MSPFPVGPTVRKCDINCNETLKGARGSLHSSLSLMKRITLLIMFDKCVCVFVCDRVLAYISNCFAVCTVDGY